MVSLPKPAASRKRKSDALGDDAGTLFPADVPEIDEDDPRLEMTDKDTCNSVRRKIRDWTTSGAMKVGEFQAATGISSNGYANFMKRTTAWDGMNCDAYPLAFAFFKKRELQGLPLKKMAPKAAKLTAPSEKAAKLTAPSEKAAAKSTSSSLLDVSGISLDGEETRSVPVFETCDSLRRMIRAFLAKDGVTNAAFCREIAKTLPSGGERSSNVAPATMTRFLGLKGPRSGNTTNAFYAAYVFLEKRRIKDGKPKSNFRLDMEEMHLGIGMDIKNDTNTRYVGSVAAGPTLYVDKYGLLGRY